MGELLAVGLSHHTAPVEIRERMAMDESTVKERLARLRSEGACAEALIVSTCNRVELYAVPQSLPLIRAWMGEHRGPRGESIDKYLYWYRNEEAVRHLFRVASSLDSLVVGEPQILGQVKTAVRIAEESRSMGRLLNRLTRQTMSVAKRVRTETKIGQNRVGVGNAGVDLALQIFGRLDDKRALLCGVGEMGRQVARAMVGSGLRELIVANRTYERSVECAADFGGTAIAWDRMHEYLGQVDVVITATGAQRPIIGPEHIRNALRVRRYRPLFLVDLSVPRNIDPAIDDIDEAFLFNVDDLVRVMDAGKRERERAAEEADQLVSVEATRFMQRLKEVEVGTHIGQMTKRAEQIRGEQLGRSEKLLAQLEPDQRAAVEALTRALTKQLLHGQIAEIRRAAREGEPDVIATLMRPWSDEE